jgi:hypothetical protein
MNEPCAREEGSKRHRRLSALLARYYQGDTENGTND